MQHKDNFDIGREVFVREWLIKVRFVGGIWDIFVIQNGGGETEQ